MYIPLNRPYTGKEEIDAIRGVLDSGMVSSGAVVEEFEEVVRKYVGAKYAVAVSSATAGIYLALKAYDIWKEALVPAFTFPAAEVAVNEAIDYGATLVDVSRGTMNSEAGNFQMEICKEMAHGSNVGCVIPIHQYGFPVMMNELHGVLNWHFGESKEMPVIIEDAACALGSEYQGEKIGAKGTAVFSFHGRKIVTTGEGGMVVTDNEEVYEKIREGREYGKDKKGTFSGTGLNFKLSNIAAAMGIVQMGKIDEIIWRRKNIARRYDELLSSQIIDNYDWYNYYHPPYFGLERRYTDTNWQSYVIQFYEKKGIPTRDRIMEIMRLWGIEVQIGSYDNSEGGCPESARLARTTLALPIWPGMNYSQVENVVDALCNAILRG
jgi:perosamine synthetase